MENRMVFIGYFEENRFKNGMIFQKLKLYNFYYLKYCGEFDIELNFENISRIARMEETNEDWRGKPIISGINFNFLSDNYKGKDKENVKVIASEFQKKI